MYKSKATAKFNEKEKSFPQNSLWYQSVSRAGALVPTDDQFFSIVLQQLKPSIYRHLVVGDEKTIKPLDSTSPYYLHPSDGPQITICPIVLRGENYNEWVRSMRNNFRAKNKLGFLDGTVTKPKEGTPEASLWVPVNSTLVGWIHNTLDPVLRSSIPQPDDVKDMWDDIRQRFSIGNGPRIHELKTLLGACKQRGHSVVHYYNNLRKIWDELAGYSTEIGRAHV